MIRAAGTRDAYFHFPYPFLCAVPGFAVRAKGLPDGERDRNLEMLRFISREAAARGLHFQLGIWNHAYKWIESPDANFTIEGLTPETHAAYCREALLTVLKACPDIHGVTLRVGEATSVAKGRHEFWKVVFEGVVKCGRHVEIDMEAAGADARMRELAAGTGMPVNVSPKCWGDHMGLPYLPASAADGSSYGELFASNRRYGVLQRIWPGTSRILLWADPQTTASYSRVGSFCGGAGVEILEPLSFKGRRGSGSPGGRCGYADPALTPSYDWEKYIHSYRVWGRSLYDPLSDQNVRRRYLSKCFGSTAAEKAAGALSDCSRILTMLTTAHQPAAHDFWPEMYTNMPIVGGSDQTRFGTVSPADPQLFAGVDEFGEMLLGKERNGRVSPLEVAQFLEAMAGYVDDALLLSAKAMADTKAPEFRRLATDVAIQAGLGRFFAAKLRSGVLYFLYTHSGDSTVLEIALEQYRKARAAWAKLAEQALVYRRDLTFGNEQRQRGRWLDRLTRIDEDIANMSKTTPLAVNVRHEEIRQAVSEVLNWRHGSVDCRHSRVSRFQPGQPLSIGLEIRDAARTISARLYYRHVNQAENWKAADMEKRRASFGAVIGAEYTQSPYPLQYYFELREGRAAWLYPGLGPKRTSQPYYVVERS